MASKADSTPGGTPTPTPKLDRAMSRQQSSALVHGFGVSARELSKLHVAGKHDECVALLDRLGGVRGIADKLTTKLRTGIPGDSDDLAHRKEAYGVNVFPEPPFAGFWALFFDAFKDPIQLILIAAAIVSFAVGLADDPSHGWIDGISITIAVLLVAFVSAGNNYNKEMQFRSLKNDAADMVMIRVLRSGANVFVPVKEIVVGDVVHLETGDKIVADGIFISGNSVKTEEGAITGESDNVSKDAVRDPFLISGTSMAAGTCDMLVTSVGVRSMQGRIMADTATEAGDTPLQVKLGVMAHKIGYFGFSFAIATFVAMIISWFADNSALKGDYPTFKNWIIHAFITAVTIVVVAIPEGLPLAVTISLAYSTRRMFRDKNLIRVLAACETMGNATDICSDKTGTLTENRMTVTQAWFGGDVMEFPSSDMAPSPDRSANFARFKDGEVVSMLKDHLSVNSTAVVTWETSGKANVRGSKTEGAGVLLVESLGYRHSMIRGSVAEQGLASEEGRQLQVGAGSRRLGNLDEVVMVQPRTKHERDAKAVTVAGNSSNNNPKLPAPKMPSARDLDGADHAEGAVHLVAQYPFNADRKMMSTIVSLDPSDTLHGPVRVYVSGASEVVLRRSTAFLWPSNPANQRSDSSSARIVSSTPERVRFVEENIIINFAKQSLRTIGLAYRDYPSRNDLPASWQSSPDEWAPGTPTVEEGLTFYGVLGIKDPLRPDVKEAVAACHRAGIMVRMVTGDNAMTAAAIAKECGILSSPDDLVVEGPVFRNMTPAEVDAVLPRLKVMARSSPRDKNLLVRRLNGALPKNREEWEAEHAEEEMLWDTDCMQYIEESLVAGNNSESKPSERDHRGERGAPKGFEGLNQILPSNVDRRGMKVQDAVLPGYYEEWLASRKLGNEVRKAVVGVTGDGTNDAPALKAADVGLSMGLGGTQVAKDASDIVILDDRFSSIVRAVLWGRSVYDNIRKFLQFQLTVNVVAVLLVFISAVTQREPPLAPVQLLWVNLIMDTMGALALGTEVPSDVLLDRRPYKVSSFIVSRPMVRNILTQSAYQLGITLWLVYAGKEVFGITPQYMFDFGYTGSLSELSDNANEYLNTFIFNTFVMCQLFNEFNARNIDSKVNVWYGLHKNLLFMLIILVTIGGQVFIVEVGGRFTRCTGLTWAHWGWSFLLGSGSWPVGILMRFIPADEPEDTFANYYGIANMSTSTTGRISDSYTHAPGNGGSPVVAPHFPDSSAIAGKLTDVTQVMIPVSPVARTGAVMVGRSNGISGSSAAKRSSDPHTEIVVESV